MGACSSHSKYLLEGEDGHMRSNTWCDYGGEKLEGVIRDGSVSLVDAAWLVNLAEKDGRLARRQDLPAEAFVTVEQLMATEINQTAGTHTKLTLLPVCILSYPWLQPGHPDPHGWTLKLVARFLKILLRAVRFGRVGVIIDFTALHQSPRTKEEDAVFKRGLQSLNQFYAHEHVGVLLITEFPEGYPQDGRYNLPQGANVKPYMERGWTYTEYKMSSLIKSSGCLYDLSKMSSYLKKQCGDDAEKLAQFSTMYHIYNGFKVRPLCGGPLAPKEFEEELRNKTFTCKKDDFDRVVKLYTSAFRDQFMIAKDLNYIQLDWTHEDATRLADVIRATKLPAVESITIEESDIGAKGVMDMAAAFASQGAMPNLVSLKLTSSSRDAGMGVEGATALANAWKAGATPALLKLDLFKMGICDEGMKALALALTEGALPDLQELSLLLNNIGDEGVIATAAALSAGAMPKLKTLAFGENAGFSENAIAAFAASLAAGGAPALKELWLNGKGQKALSKVTLARGIKLKGTSDVRQEVRNTFGI